MRLFVGPAFCDLMKGGKLGADYGVWSLGVPLKERRKGHCKKLLRAIRKWADRTGNTVWLGPNPFGYQGPPPLDKEKLYAMYRMMGWRDCVPGCRVSGMVYDPSQNRRRRCRFG